MLLNLHVKNVALIDEADVNLGEGLNILTGETGAGKSILIDAVTMALGAKVTRSLVRDEETPAQAELLFQVVGKEKRRQLEELGVTPEEDDCVLISRKIRGGKSVCRINDETVTVSKLRAVTSLLIDIHGQHEHQSLLHRSKHLEILDAYAKHQEAEAMKQMQEAYRELVAAKKELSAYEIGDDERIREQDFLAYEIRELEQANLKKGELEDLEKEYKRMMSAGKLISGVSKAMDYTGDSHGAADSIGRAVRELAEAANLDEQARDLYLQAEEVENLLNDLNRALSDYAADLEFDEAELVQTERRLDELHSLQVKYGDSYEAMMEALSSRRERLEDLISFDERKQKAQKALKKAADQAELCAKALSDIRKVEAFHLTESIRAALVDLNFLDVQFTMAFYKKEQIGIDGYDEMEFLISTNPGEEPRPLGMVASGGELSRIMLAIKAVLADSDDIDTLIFDEIDAGISGRTAQKVSEKLNQIGRSHQVICITHLPQIAAMADCHYKIEKSIKGTRTVTDVTKLSADEEIAELSRLLGGAEITEAVEDNAREMKALANNKKIR